DHLKQLAAAADVAGQSPQILLLLAAQLKNTGAMADPLVRKALLHHPTDFWLHFSLGNVTTDPPERIGCYQAALAVRPGSAPAHNNLGLVLYDKGDLDGAVTHFHKAIQLNVQSAKAHYNLGIVLHAKEDLDGAITHYHKALALDPKYARAHNNLGNVLVA